MLTPEGSTFVTKAAQSLVAIGRDRFLLIEAFGGIGGARRAVEHLHVEVCCYVHADCSEEAQRVCAERWPESIRVPRVEDITVEFLGSLARRRNHIDVVVVFSGPPCQDVADLNAGVWLSRDCAHAWWSR